MFANRFALLSLLGPFLSAGLARAADDGLVVRPASVVLRGKAARQRLIVGGTREGRAVDLTRAARFTSDNLDVARVGPDGIVTPAGSGTANVVVTADGREVRVAVRVVDGERFLPVTFEGDVQPILTRFGCNAGACHGKQRGQNGFQLSLLGFDSDFDYTAVTQEGRGRRIAPAAIEQSLLLRKPTAQLPHGGGKRLDVGGPAYELLRRWLGAAAPRRPHDAPVIQRITLEPSERLLAPRGEQQLLITAHYSDGTNLDVTHLAAFQSSDNVIAAVSPSGLIKAGPLPGEAAIMARFQEKFAVCNVLIPLPGNVAPDVYAQLPRNNFIDGLVWDKLQRLGVTPSAAANDATFHRRAFLDVIGRLPTPAETRMFLADNDPHRRVKLIDALLQRPEYADYWANKWADLLRPNPYRVGIKAVYNLQSWLRESFRENMPYDRFVREIVTAQGSTYRHGPAVVFRDRREPDEITTMMSQLFLGVRLECAKCHHHPFEKWSQDDFYSLAAYFARIGRKGGGISPPISGNEEILFTALRGEVKHPLTGQVLPPRPLFGKAPSLEGERDPRQALAEWMTAEENPYFARVLVNRVWADLMGRGLVEPVDDLRATNPPSIGPLLDALAADFRKNGYDLKKLLRTIMASHVYGLSSLPSERNRGDLRNYSRHYRQRLRAEVLLDALGDVTDVPETFNALPPGSRAMELWTNRSQSVFLDSFGRPDPNQDPPCERTPDTTVVQALHLMNSPNVQRKVTSDTGRAATLAASKQTPAEVVDELYLLVYSRLPDTDEKRQCVKLFEDKDMPRRQVVEDLLWALINTPEFVFKD